MTAKQCLQHPWLSCRVDPEKILEISIKEEEEESSDQLESTNQDTDCDCGLPNKNTSESESTNQNLDNSRLTIQKENPEEVLREISKENISTERGTSGDEDVKKFKKCSDIFESCGKGVDSSSMECNENKDSIIYTPSSIDPMDADDDADNKVSYV